MDWRLGWRAASARSPSYGEWKGENGKWTNLPLPLWGGQDSQAAAILTAWLDGQRLLRDRLLAILNEAGIQAVPTIGQPFDPYRHVAVSTVEDEALPDGHIVAEERQGYTAGDHVLRYAEVVVVKNGVTRNEEQVTSNTQYPIPNTRNEDTDKL